MGAPIPWQQFAKPPLRNACDASEHVSEPGKRIEQSHEYNRNGRGCRFQGDGCLWPGGNYQIGAESRQLGGQSGIAERWVGWSKLFVANFGLRYQDAAGKIFDQ